MFRPKLLLKVISILMIISGVLGVFGTVVSYVMLPQLSEVPGVDMSAITAAYTPLAMVLGILTSVTAAGAGIFGIAGKSVKWATIFAGIYTALIVIATIRSMVGGTFTFLAIMDYIIPALYWWGLYQSRE